jgi:hypothetical protein
MTVSHPDIITMSKELFDSLPVLYQRTALEGQKIGRVKIIEASQERAV